MLEMLLSLDFVKNLLKEYGLKVKLNYPPRGYKN